MLPELVFDELLLFELLLLVDVPFWLRIAPLVLVLVSFVTEPLTVPDWLPVAPVCSLDVLQPAISAATPNIARNRFIFCLMFITFPAHNVLSRKPETTGAESVVS